MFSSTDLTASFEDVNGEVEKALTQRTGELEELRLYELATSWGHKLLE